MKSKLAALLIVGSILLASLIAGLQAVEVAEANWVIMPQSPITDSPTLIIQSPINNTFYTDSVALNFTVTKPASWMPTASKPYGAIHSIIYTLDGQKSTIYAAPQSHVPFDELEPSTNFSIPLDGVLSNGTHTLEVTAVGTTVYFIYSTPPPNAHNWASSPIMHEYSMSASETVTFTTSRYIESTPSPSQNPTPSPASTSTLVPTVSSTQQLTLSIDPTSTVPEFTYCALGLLLILLTIILTVIFGRLSSKARGVIIVS